MTVTCFSRLQRIGGNLRWRNSVRLHATVAVEDSVVKMTYTIGHSKMLKIYRLRCKKMNIIVKFDDI